MKISSSLLLEELVFFWKRYPRIGILDSQGTAAWSSFRVTCRIPPITAVSPSRISTSVVAFFLLMAGCPVAPTSPWESFFASSFMMTLPSGVMWGVTLRLKVASTNWVFVPEADTVEYGIWVPCSIRASLLSIVTTWGEDPTFPFPEASRADRERSRRRLSLRIPKVIPPPEPSPTAAGRFTANFGGVVTGEQGVVLVWDCPGMKAPSG